MTFRTILTDHMEQNEMTQTQLARKLGVSPSTVSSWLNGYYQPPVEEQTKILDKLMVDEVERPPNVQAFDEDFERMTVTDAAKIMHTSPNVIKKGLIQRVFPWGYAIEMEPGRWDFLINAKKFREIELGAA